MKRITFLTALTALLALWTITVAFVPSAAEGAVPQLINFQGILRDGSGNSVANSSYSVVFTIYDAPSGGTNLWTETQSVTTISGLFTVLLGTVTPVPADIFDFSDRWLGIQVSPDPEMTPRQKLTSVVYSLRSEQWTSAAQDLFRVNGNVGIGTAFPLHPLHVQDPAGGIFVCRFATGNTIAMVAEFSNTSSGAVWEYGVGGSGGSFVPPGSMYLNKQGLSSPPFVISSVGNVGIGTNSPVNQLDVEGAAVIGAAYSGSGTAPPNGLAVEGNVGIGYNAPVNKLSVAGAASIGALYANTFAPANGLIVQGNVGIGTDSPSAKLHVKGAGFPGSFGYFDTDASSQDAGLRFQEAGVVKSHLYHQASTNTLNLYGEGFSGISVTSIGRVGIGTTAPTALLHVNGTAGNNTGVWSNLSDRRLKKDIEPIQNALETVTQLQPVTFRWKEATKDAQYGRVRGLIAQDVEKVIPEWIKTDPDGYKRLEPIGIDALLIEAIKELKAENEELRNRIFKLETEKPQAKVR